MDLSPVGIRCTNSKSSTVCLQGARVKTTPESGGSEIVRVARSLDEARALIEKSFGNYVGSEVMVAAKQQLARLQKDIEQLEKECAKDDEGLEGRLTRGELQEYLTLKERAKVAFSSLNCNLWLGSLQAQFPSLMRRL